MTFAVMKIIWLFAFPTLGIKHASHMQNNLCYPSISQRCTTEGFLLLSHSHTSSTSLHWLLMYYRIHFKGLLFAFKCLPDLIPSYLSNLLQYYVPSWSLKSADQLTFPKLGWSSEGTGLFVDVVPKLCNEFPLNIRQDPSLSGFKSHLKARLFSLAWPSVSCWLMFAFK